MCVEAAEAGQSAGEIPRTHEGKECVVVLEGVLEVEVSGVQYRFRNPGSEPTVLIGAISPPSF